MLSNILKRTSTFGCVLSVDELPIFPNELSADEISL
jgi:hypothetical protein